MNRLWFVIATAIITGCASQTPAPIREAPATNLNIAEVRSDPAQYKDAQVRWGGVITRVENKPSQTLIEVVSQELRKDGQPSINGRSSGRFIASFAEFLDPIIYSNGRLLTVVGTIAGETTRAIGEYQYAFPIVTVSSAYLWPIEEVSPPPDYPPPWWYYDPWPYHHYDPWPFPRPFLPYNPYHYW
jgi:outer membrane lipoprotein